ncbi:NAD-dependent epimerase/dehydratase family protein [Kutzneria buriramensis]|uniref:Nucleoside-diphosphate-sugar epimerase n=1 Tax=Kutzneria buriramensis TaxID=1045776 RepID=A0A3E0I559_9PSEU|nr:NAD-dependent epimerase/dehydratase family protein [Kutzneria buriramensis]REH53872.1 nucleoside-diphosphate-sugar epimerase [Kutzneria buriramensis]
MKVFLTGGSGYVGRPTIQALTRHGHQVAALARTDESAALVEAAGAIAVRGELTNTDVLREQATLADAVIHLGMAGVNTAEVDLAAARAMQDGLADRGPYIHTGGTWVFGDTDGVADETHPMAPPALTSWRLDNERQVLDHGGRPVIVMPGLVYGNHGGLIEAFYVEPARKDGELLQIGDGSTHWALVHVEDLAELYVRALDAKPRSVYVGVDDQNPTTGDVSRVLAKSLDVPVREVTEAEAAERMGPIAEAFALDQRLTAAKARRELGWLPKHTDALAELG